ncbi:MAG: class I SAM-dependent methyltransferase [SAR202 cluster bacterium]|nr:class I SAM-dependent methyltransferase [SAR202 cluster bacterium]|tara:strand:- start:3108 stop:4145 length:1038 start_codon:yes stop_codon:yes gene_type:complete
MWYEFFIDHSLIPRNILIKFIQYFLKRHLAKFSNNKKDILKIQKNFSLKHSKGQLAKSTKDANKQHYEFPIYFFKTVLGTNLKYSGSYWPNNSSDLNEAEITSLNNYLERAQIKSGESILELGCGWGSLSIHLASKFPKNKLIAVTNSIDQFRHIKKVGENKNLNNLEVIHSDINNFDPKIKFDKIISIEMFEHMYNISKLLKLTHSWLNQNGKLFFQVFSHKSYPQDFDNIKSSWMSKYFFTNGMMPYDGFYKDINSDFVLTDSWTENGTHYSKTLYAWLNKLDKNSEEISYSLASQYKTKDIKKFINRWKLFFIICAELFGYKNGTEWRIKQYLFTKESKNKS